MRTKNAILECKYKDVAFEIRNSKAVDIISSIMKQVKLFHQDSMLLRD